VVALLSCSLKAPEVRQRDERPFKKGGFVIAQQQRVPILPITVAGSGRILPPDGRTVRSSAVAVIVAEPIPSSVTASSSIDEIAQQTRAVVLDNEEQWVLNLQE